jgi:hypothetical protein
MTCTFRPAGRNWQCPYDLSCYENHELEDREVSLPDPMFIVFPTAWFRKAQNETPAVIEGFELAAKPNRHPDLTLLWLAVPSTPAAQDIEQSYSRVSVEVATLFSYKSAVYHWEFSTSRCLSLFFLLLTRRNPLPTLCRIQKLAVRQPCTSCRPSRPRARPLRSGTSRNRGSEAAVHRPFRPSSHV